MVNIEAIIWYAFLIDSVGANITALFFKKWYQKKSWNKWLPISIWWTLMYLALTLWVGFTLYRLGILPY